jgi:hypothetical protein
MVRDVQTQQGLGVNVLAVRVLVGARFAFCVVVAGREGRLAEARDG